MSEMKTIEGWQEHAIATGNDRMDGYLEAGDLVAQDIVDYFAEVVPPRAMSESLLQVGTPHDMRIGADGEKHPTYATFTKSEDGWQYCGPCFAGETVEPSIEDRENCFDPPEYEYDTGDGIERVQLTVATYDFGDNIYLGLEYFDEGLGCFDHYGDVTVNIETLPPLYAAIDTNNNGDKIMDFLEKNDIAANTGLTKESGWCTYPVVVLNPTPLFKADPERMIEHLTIRGVDPKTIMETKKKALGDAAKYVGNIDYEPLDQLKQEAKERASEKNAERSELPKKSERKPPEIEF